MSFDSPPPRVVQRYLPAFQYLIPRALMLDSLFPGSQYTSWYRTADRNMEVGGSPHSQHLLAMAYDVVPDRRFRVDYMNAARQVGLIAVDEGNHIHIQIFPAGTLKGVL